MNKEYNDSKAHDCNYRKYINKQDYQTWLEDLCIAQKQLAERAGKSELLFMHPGVRQST